MLRYFLLFFLFKLIISKNAKYYCYVHNKTNIHVKPNEIIFFETPNFPSYEIEDFCEINFYLNTSVTNLTFIAFITNPISTPTPDYPLKYDIVYDNKNITWYSSDIFHFQAYATFFEGKNDECLLESVANYSGPFHFDDETQILYIRSSIYEIKQRKNNCKWEFSAPENYGFKIVIIELDISSDVLLTARNSTNFFILNERSANPNKPYYNSDNYLIIDLSASKHTYIKPKYEFGAYISIVEKNVKNVDAECQLHNYTDLVIWTVEKGYLNNAYCSYEVIVLPNTMLYVHSEFNSMTEIVDFITYSDKINNEVFNVNKYYSGRTFYSFSNGSSKSILWEFQSDGSVVDLGFEIYFTTIYCHCQNPIWVIPCILDYSGDPHSTCWHITNSTDIYNHGDWGQHFDMYCGNLECNFTIEMNASCETTYFKVAMSTRDFRDRDISDVVRIFSDDSSFYYFNSLNASGFKNILMNSNKTTTIKVVSGENSQVPRFMYFCFEPADEPKYVGKTYLTKKKPYFIIDGSNYWNNDFFSVEIENTKEFQYSYIEIYSSDKAALISYTFYTDEKMSKVLQYDKCLDSTNFYCKTDVKSLSVLVTSNYSIFLFFHIASKEPSNSCFFSPNAFVLYSYSYLIPAKNYTFELSEFSAAAGGKNTIPCRIYLLTFDSSTIFDQYILYYLRKIWTSSKERNVKIYTGFENETLLFEYNSLEQWQPFTLYSHFYIFEFPPNSSIYINANQFPDDVTKIESFESQTIIHTPYYSAIRKYQETFPRPPQNIANYIIDEDTFVTFNVTYYNVSPYMTFEFFVDDTLHKMDEVGKTLTVTNSTVTINYIPPDYYSGVPNYPGAIIHLSINPKNMNTTTPFSLTTLTQSEITTSSMETNHTTEKSDTKNDNYSLHLLHVLFSLLSFFAYFCV